MLDDDLKKKVIDHYQKGQGSIQDIARVYRLTVDEVLVAIGQQEMTVVNMPGDQIDPSELGPGDAPYKPYEQQKVTYSTD